MSAENQRVVIEKLATGVPGLDQVLGGGLPEYSFNLIVGSPGSGKTTLAHQIVFANASAERPALYFTVLGEPALKMLRYQQQMSFFDPEKVGENIRFVDLSRIVLEQDLDRVLESIVSEVQSTNPSIVVVDSFRTVLRATTMPGAGEASLQYFVQRLALRLASWQATSFLVGEYSESEMASNPVFTVADGILWLTQSIYRNSIVRKLQVTKLRGQASMPGLHTFRITSDGLRVYPRIPQRGDTAKLPRSGERISTGVAGMDEMLGGGIPTGDSVLVAGPSGSGKTLIATQFVAEGVAHGERAVIAVFEEHPQEYLDRARNLGFDLEKMIRDDKLRVIYIRPLDLSVDETLEEIQDAAREIGARRVVIDSLSGFELALAPAFRDDFRESLYRLVGALTGQDITVLMTVEVIEAYDRLNFSSHEVSFLADDIILQRYAEIDGRLRKAIAVVKMRRSEHSDDFRAYAITPSGLVVGQTLGAYRGIITGVPQLSAPASQPTGYGLTDGEARVLRALESLGESEVDGLARAANRPRAEVSRAVGRLVDLSYAVSSTESGRKIYRPVARPAG